MKTLVLLIAVFTAALFTGCEEGGPSCPAGQRTVSAEARQTTITAPPGGGSRQFIRVLGRNFTPGSSVTIFFLHYPARDPNQDRFEQSASTAGDGTLTFQKDLFELPARDVNGDPNVDVFVSARDGAGCFAATNIKAGEILRPPS